MTALCITRSCGTPGPRQEGSLTVALTEREIIKDWALGFSCGCHKHSKTSMCRSQDHGSILKVSHVDLKGLYFNGPVRVQLLIRAHKQTAWGAGDNLLFKWKISPCRCPSVLISFSVFCTHYLLTYMLALRFPLTTYRRLTEHFPLFWAAFPKWASPSTYSMSQFTYRTMGTDTNMEYDCLFSRKILHSWGRWKHTRVDFSAPKRNTSGLLIP